MGDDIMSGFQPDAEAPTAVSGRMDLAKAALAAVVVVSLEWLAPLPGGAAVGAGAVPTRRAT